jgi:lipopolysaccharide export system protein LptA
MVCRADTIEFNRETKKLYLIGNSVVEWKGDVYRASSTTVDLDSEEIEMEGTIKGTVHG